ncbi:autophagy-related protein 13b isoform X2 [Neltuma alba]|uniref:autophagy-related protein 13b isoform X2 n=1 Tax=Neltuma alba TaxID=207710 RepID=UPI0010A4963C|nr:autophagy-related protein 13b isoform X2 [Prosopis alba]
MASSQSNAHSEAAKMEQIITAFFAKSLHIILESRALYGSSRNSSSDPTGTSPSSSSSSSSPSVRLRDKWFNLALRECPAALENNLEPIVVDVILMQKPLQWNPVSLSPENDLRRSSSPKERWNADQEELGVEAKSEKIVERWVLQYESRKARESNSSSRRSSSISLHSLYKKLTLLLRSLYASVRLLPAHKIFRDLNSSGQVRTFTLFHRVSSFAEPFNRKEEAEMLKFGFTPVDTSCGRLCLSVEYRPSVPDVSSEPSTPISPRVITDYVGSPLADPLRRFPSLPVTGLPSHGSPSSLPFSRRHSWSFDRCRASPPSIGSSPSPTHSEPRTSVPNINSRRFPPSSLPPHPPEMPLQKNKTFDEYYPSPMMSPSPSPSPPIYSLGSLRPESAPVNIPTANVTDCPENAHGHDLLRSPSKTGRGFNMIQYGATAEKISFSRSSSRSCQDDNEDPDFTCPFDWDDVDMIDPSSRFSSL